MISKIEVSVGSDLVGAFFMDQKQTEFLKRIVDATKKNPTLVDLTNLEKVPQVGMKYDGVNFFKTKDLDFSENSFDKTQKVFGFVVNSILVAVQHLHTDGMEHFIAAYQSNPTFKVYEVENDQS